MILVGEWLQPVKCTRIAPQKQNTLPGHSALHDSTLVCSDRIYGSKKKWSLGFGPQAQALVQLLFDPAYIHGIINQICSHKNINIKWGNSIWSFLWIANFFNSDPGTSPKDTSDLHVDPGKIGLTCWGIELAKDSYRRVGILQVTLKMYHFDIDDKRQIRFK